MTTEKVKEFLELKQRLLKEIEYRESVLKELRYESKQEKGFVFNFMHNFLKSKVKGVNPYWVNNEAYARFLIDADKELHNDIAIAFEKSIEKLKKEFNAAVI